MRVDERREEKKKGGHTDGIIPIPLQIPTPIRYGLNQAPPPPAAAAAAPPRLLLRSPSPPLPAMIDRKGESPKQKRASEPKRPAAAPPKGHGIPDASSFSAAAALTLAPNSEPSASASASATASSSPIMKGQQWVRTKVVVRHLPPSLSEKAFLEQIELRFTGLYNWVSYCQGKSSQKQHLYSRAHINFNHPEDVFVFFEAFNGHVFVNEKGTQFKVSVEYAPYQRTPKAFLKKDAREGSILKDPEYLEYLDILAKPVEYLPSAEVQLERREAEKAAGGKDAVIVTPLMEFVRQKRASKAGHQRLLHSSGKANSRAYGSSSAVAPRRMADRSRISPSYILKSGSRSKEKSTYIPRRGQEQDITVGEKKCKEIVEGKEKKNAREIADLSKDNSEPSISAKDNHHLLQAVASGTEMAGLSIYTMENEQGDSPRMYPGNKVPLSLATAAGFSKQSFATSKSASGSSFPSTPGRSGGSSTSAYKQSQRRESGGRYGRSPAAVRDVGSQPQLSAIDSYPEKEKRHHKSQFVKSSGKDSNALLFSPEADTGLQQSSPSKLPGDEKGCPADYFPSGGGMEARHLRNKDRPDRPVWTVRRRADVSNSDLVASPIELGDASGRSSIEYGRQENFESGQGSGSAASIKGLEIASPKRSTSVQEVFPRKDFVILSRSSDSKLQGIRKAVNPAGENGDGVSLAAEKDHQKQDSSALWSDAGNQRVTRRDNTLQQGVKEAESLLSVTEASKPVKRGGVASHERQVWVAKSGSGT